jgi:hypothetical protein
MNNTTAVKTSNPKYQVGLSPYGKGNIWIKGVYQQGTEDNSWTGESDRKIEKITQ